MNTAGVNFFTNTTLPEEQDGNIHRREAREVRVNPRHHRIAGRKEAICSGLLDGRREGTELRID